MCLKIHSTVWINIYETLSCFSIPEYSLLPCFKAVAFVCMMQTFLLCADHRESNFLGEKRYLKRRNLLQIFRLQDDCVLTTNGYIYSNSNSYIYIYGCNERRSFHDRRLLKRCNERVLHRFDIRRSWTRGRGIYRPAKADHQLTSESETGYKPAQGSWAYSLKGCT